MEIPDNETIHYLSAPFECYDTKKERSTQAKKIKKELEIPAATHLFVWDIQHCLWQDNYQGGVTSMLNTGKYWLGDNTSYFGWNPRVNDGQESDIFYHEFWHQLNAQHCSVFYLNGYCIVDEL